MYYLNKVYLFLVNFRGQKQGLKETGRLERFPYLSLFKGNRH